MRRWRGLRQQAYHGWGGGGSGERPRVLLTSTLSAQAPPSVHDLAVLWGMEGGTFVPIIKTKYLLCVRRSRSPGHSNISKRLTPSEISQCGQEDSRENNSNRAREGFEGGLQ